jgi:hypothetical protein
LQPTPLLLGLIWILEKGVCAERRKHLFLLTREILGKQTVEEIRQVSRAEK